MEDLGQKQAKQTGYLPENIKFHSAFGSRRPKQVLQMKPRLLNFEDFAVGREENTGSMQEEALHSGFDFSGVKKSLFRQDSIFDEQPEKKDSQFCTGKKLKQTKLQFMNERTKENKKPSQSKQLSFLFDQITIPEVGSPKLNNLMENGSDSNTETPRLETKRDLVLHRWMKQDEVFTGKLTSHKRIDLDNRFQVQPLSKVQSSCRRRMT